MTIPAALCRVGGALLLTMGLDTLLESTVCLRVTTDVLPPPVYPDAPLPRILLLSDLHDRRFGRGNLRLIRAVAAARPDVIAIPGDFVSRTVTDLTDAKTLLQALCKLAPVVLSLGNHELDLPPATLDAYRAMVADCGATLLENAICVRSGVPFAGLTLSRAHYRAEAGYRHLAACTASDVSAALGSASLRPVLLAHNPLFAQAYADWGARLVLSGHVHGGVVRLPWLGGLLSPERRFFPQYDKGVYHIGATTLVVSAGLGKLRFGNPPELRVITQTPKREIPHNLYKK